MTTKTEPAVVVLRLQVTPRPSTALNIRTEPGGDVIGTYEAGEIIDSLESTEDSTWCRTERGWVMRQYCTEV